MTKSPEDKKLHSVLHRFVMDAISHLRKTTDITKIPVTAQFEVREEDGGQKHIVKSEKPNWWQVNSYINPVLGLPSCKQVVEACFEHPLIESRHRKVAYALNYGVSFSRYSLVKEFLAECVARQNALRFSQRTFENVFCDFGNFLKSAAKNFARLVAPLDMVRLDQKQIQLGPHARVRRLSPSQVVDLANHCPQVSHFYDSRHWPWFNTVLELDCTFEWKWTDEAIDGQENWSGLKEVQEAERRVLELTNRLIQEIFFLRSLLRKRICCPTYFIDYRGWNSVISSGGPSPHLPWIRPPFPSLFSINKSEARKFAKVRERFLSIQDEKTKRRIFAAMRRLSSSLERYYSGDRLLDAVAGLEGLLVNSRMELRHQFAEHIALLLERQPQKRAKLFNEMCSAYDLRSKIAHGEGVADDLFAIIGGDEPPKKQWPEFNAVNKLSGRCGELLHKAIMICIDREMVDFDWINMVMTGGK